MSTRFTDDSTYSELVERPQKVISTGSSLVRRCSRSPNTGDFKQPAVIRTCTSANFVTFDTAARSLNARIVDRGDPEAGLEVTHRTKLLMVGIHRAYPLRAELLPRRRSTTASRFSSRVPSMRSAPKTRLGGERAETRVPSLTRGIGPNGGVPLCSGRSEMELMNRGRDPSVLAVHWAGEQDS